MILRLVIFNFIIAFFSLKSQTVFSNFNNNPLNFEILQSSNYKLSLLNGNYEILSYSKNGIVSFFYIDTVSRIKNISVTINNTKIKNECKTGLIFDFVDWKNYGYFLISDKFYYIGYVKQGVYSELVDSKHSSFISSTGNDLEITINDFEAVFSKIIGRAMLSWRDQILGCLKNGSPTGFCVPTCHCFNSFKLLNQFLHPFERMEVPVVMSKSGAGNFEGSDKNIPSQSERPF